MKDAEVAQAIAGSLTRNGIRCKANLLDATLFSQKDLGKDLDGLMFESIGNFLLDADLIYTFVFSTEARDMSNGGKGQSSYSWAPPEFEAIITEARYTLDPQKRNALYAQAQHMMFDAAPALFMYLLTDIYGVDNWVKWEPRFDEMVWAHEMTWNE
jgi:peptide/nickel transport system substrate-binding protein